MWMNGQTQTDMTKLKIAFRNFVDAPKTIKTKTIKF